MGYRQTWAVYTRRSGSVQIHPDRPRSVSELESVLILTELEWTTKKLDQTDSVIFVTWTGRFSTWSSSGKWQWNVQGFLQLMVVISW